MHEMSYSRVGNIACRVNPTSGAVGFGGMAAGGVGTGEEVELMKNFSIEGL